MSAIPQEWIEAGAHEILGEAAGYCGPGYGTCGETHVGRDYAADLAEAVLTATLPLIREALAAQIEARLHHGCTDYECVHAESHMAVSRAAAIVRGEA